MLSEYGVGANCAPRDAFLAHDFKFYNGPAYQWPLPPNLISPKKFNNNYYYLTVKCFGNKVEARVNETPLKLRQILEITLPRGAASPQFLCVGLAREAEVQLARVL